MSISRLSRAGQDAFYTHRAREYMASLPLEHFMEAIAQSTQRKITVASLELVTAQRPEVHVFSELLVQWPIRGRRRPGQIVPDNMVVVHDGPIDVDTHYTIPIQPCSPLWVLEYVSQSSERKDYGSSMEVYERSLRIPYYLTFHPEGLEMNLFRLNSRRRYRSVVPGSNGRCPIEELELEVGMVDQWVRFWFRGELLPLPAELQQQLFQTRERLAISEQQRATAEARLHTATERLSSTEEQLHSTEEQLHTTEERLNSTEEALALEREQRRALEQRLAALLAQQVQPPTN